MPAHFIPSARAIFVCDFCVGYSNGTVDLYGVFNQITTQEYPHERARFCIYAQLSDSEGDVPFFVDVRYAADDSPVFTTRPQILRFHDRLTVAQLALNVENCRFPRPGVYSVELVCKNEVVAETRIFLFRPEADD